MQWLLQNLNRLPESSSLQKQLNLIVSSVHLPLNLEIFHPALSRGGFALFLSIEFEPSEAPGP